MSDRETFKYRFRPGVQETAYHWTNPDGSTGGVVAVSATVSAGVTISETAEVFPEAHVGSHAHVGTGVIIEHGARIGDHAHVGDHARVGSRAYVGSRANIGNIASIRDYAHVGSHVRIGACAIFKQGDWLFTAGPQGSRSDIVSVIWSPGGGLRWWVGCQQGITTDALVRRIETTHGTGPHAEDYRHLIRMVETHPGLARAKAAHAAKGDVNG